MGLTLGSLFDGIAGFPLSASRYGIATKWASEIEAFPIKVTEKHFPDMKHIGDATKINGADIEPVDVISFGSPCQDMSVAGKREGLGGARSGLFIEAVRIIKEMREATNGVYPRFAIWENVPGAFSSNNGHDFRAVLEEITEAEIPIPFSGRWAEAGMVRGNGREVAWRVLDAQYWGVPQRRKRIFLVADLAGQCAGEILFEREGLPGNIAESGEEGKEIAAGAGNGVGFTMQAFGKYADTGKASTIKQQDYKDATDLVVISCATKQQSQNIGYGVASPLMASDYKEPQAIMVENHPADSRVKIDETGTTQTLTSRMGTGGGNVPMLMQPTYCLQGSMIGREDKNGPQGTGINEDVSFTLNTTDRHAVTQSNYRVRRLTPTECLRLQGFPDDWLDIEGSSDSAKYKAVGNSVAVPCVKFIFSQIVKVLRRKL